MTDVVWLLVNCNSADEARRIGDAALAARQASCFDVFPRQLTRYFWPPKSGKIEEAAGALLVLETFADRVPVLKNLVRQHHRDQLPFMGAVEITQVDDAYRKWMAGELTGQEI